MKARFPIYVEDKFHGYDNKDVRKTDTDLYNKSILVIQFKLFILKNRCLLIFAIIHFKV